MKKLIVNLLIIMAMIATGQAQDKLKIGEEKNGELVITNLAALKAYFMNSLNNSGSLGKEYKTSFSPTGDRCLIYYPVSGNEDHVNSIGVMLVKAKNQYFIVKNPPQTSSSVPGVGGSMEIQCVGVNCATCVPNITWNSGNWMPVVFCQCLNPENGICDMISKITIQLAM